MPLRELVGATIACPLGYPVAIMSKPTPRLNLSARFVPCYKALMPNGTLRRLVLNEVKPNIFHSTLRLRCWVSLYSTQPTQTTNLNPSARGRASLQNWFMHILWERRPRRDNCSGSLHPQIHRHEVVSDYNSPIGLASS